MYVESRDKIDWRILKRARSVVKIALSFFALAVLIFSAALLSAESGNSQDRDNGAVVVSGVGYPPIKAQNAAQARLMARRAAIIDAYRNSLAGGASSSIDEQTFYRGLSGFVKGLIIQKEEYLEDGGVRILAKVPGRTAAAASQSSREVTAEKSLRGPSPVPLDEWYGIIGRSVRFE